MALGPQMSLQGQVKGESQPPPKWIFSSSHNKVPVKHDFNEYTFKELNTRR